MALEVCFGLGAIIAFFALVHGLSQYRRGDRNDASKDVAAPQKLFAQSDR